MNALEVRGLILIAIFKAEGNGIKTTVCTKEKKLTALCEGG